MRPFVHLALHALVPSGLAWLVWRPRWRTAFLILMATMLVDLDHLLANPIYVPDRCSIGFHPLHTAPAIVAYVLLLGFRRTRVVGAGLLVHMALDVLDCAWMHWEST